MNSLRDPWFWFGFLANSYTFCLFAFWAVKMVGCYFGWMSWPDISNWWIFILVIAGMCMSAITLGGRLEKLFV